MTKDRWGSRPSLPGSSDPLPDRDLARAYQGATERPDRGDCPGAEVLAELAYSSPTASGEDESVRRRLVAHVADCSACALELQALRRAADLGAEDTLQEAASVRRLETRSRAGREVRWRGLLAAAALLAALGTTSIWWTNRSGDSGTVRSVPGDSTQLQPEPDAILEALPERLSWGEADAEGAQPEAVRLRLMTANGEVLVDEQIQGFSWSLDAAPSEVRDRLNQGGRFLWTIRPVESPVGGSMGPYWFEIRVDGAASGE